MEKTKTKTQALNDAQIKGLRAVSGAEGWTKISPDAQGQHGWLIHWRAYPKLEEAGFLAVKVKESPKTGREVLARLTAKGRKALTSL
jgi:ribosomal protein L34